MRRPVDLKRTNVICGRPSTLSLMLAENQRLVDKRNKAQESNAYWKNVACVVGVVVIAVYATYTRPVAPPRIHRVYTQVQHSYQEAASVNKQVDDLIKRTIHDQVQVYMCKFAKGKNCTMQVDEVDMNEIVMKLVNKTQDLEDNLELMKKEIRTFSDFMHKHDVSVEDLRFVIQQNYSRMYLNTLFRIMSLNETIVKSSDQIIKQVVQEFPQLMRDSFPDLVDMSIVQVDKKIARLGKEFVSLFFKVNDNICHRLNISSDLKFQHNSELTIHTLAKKYADRWAEAFLKQV